MYTLTVYKKSKGCPNCAILDRLAPTIQKKYPEVQWNFVVIEPEKGETVPEFVKSFPTSVLTRHEDLKHSHEVFTFAGYDGLAKKIHETLNS